METNVYFLRHGKKMKGPGITQDGALMTPEGCEQVANVARTHLAGIKFDAIATSLKPRAIQAAVIAMSVLDITDVGVTSDIAFDYTGAGFEKQMEFIMAKLRTIAATKPKLTLGDWREAMGAVGAVLTKRLISGIARLAMRTQAATPDAEDINILIVSHEAVIELISKDPNFPMLGEAGILKFTAAWDPDIEVIFPGY